MGLSHSSLSNPYQHICRELYSSQALSLTGTKTGLDERTEQPEEEAAKGREEGAKQLGAVFLPEDT